MNLNEESCWKAFSTRDGGSDGRFVAAVRTTGVYCRPGCPARLPLRRNVRFFENPGGAEKAGYRPCRRCHPQDSARGPLPGTRATVTRALKLLESGRAGAAGGAFERLAQRLGVSPRHLRRLFARHLGASPSAIARRIQAERARHLLDTTRLAVSDVAAAAGFHSRRRFNEVFRESFGLTPRGWRARRSDPPVAGRSTSCTMSSLPARRAQRAATPHDRNAKPARASRRTRPRTPARTRRQGSTR